MKNVVLQLHERMSGLHDVETAMEKGMFIHLCINVYMCMFIDINVLYYIYICKYIYIYIYTYIYIYIYI
jgi:hypothetical protein